MTKNNKTREQLIKDLEKSNKRVAELEKSEAEHTKAEKALKESEDRFRILAENARDMIYRMSLLNGSYEYVSPSSVDLFGYTPAEFYDSPMLIQKVIHPDWQKYFEEQWAKLVVGDIAPSYEYQIIHKSGETRWLHQRNVLISDNNGRPIAIEGIVTDITERKQAQYALQTSEEKFSKAFHNNPIPIYITTIPDGVFIDVNPMVEKISGFKRDEIIGKTSLELGFFEKPEDRDKLFQQLQKDGKLYDYEISFRIKAGKSRLCRVFSEIIEIQGKSHLLSMILDVTERTQFEVKLKDREEHYRSLIENANIGISIFSVDGKRISHNSKLPKIFGYTAKEYSKLQPLDLIHPEDRTFSAERLKKHMMGNQLTPDIQEYRAINKSGEVLWIEVNASRITIGGRPALQTFVTDISERKIAEEAINETNSLLQTTLESTADGILVVDLQGRIVAYNEIFMEIWEMSENIIPEGKTRDLVSPENTEYAMKHIIGQLINPEEFIAKVQELYSKPEDESFDILKFKDGRVIERYSKPQYLSDKPIGRVWSFRDVTERKKAEVALQESEEKHRTIFESANDAISLMRGEQIIECNSKALSMFRLDNKSEIIGHSPIKFSPEKQPDGSNSKEKILKYVTGVEKGMPQRFYWKHIRKDGTPFDVEVSLNRLILGGVTHHQAIARDITESKQAEEALKSSEERLKILFESAPDAYYLSDLKGTLIDGNKAAEDLMGYKKEELIGKNFLKLKLLLTKELLKASKLLVKNVQGKGTGPDEFMLNRKDGSQIPVEISTYPAKIKDKTVVLGIARDISERKKTEKELKKLSTAVEQSPSVIAITDLKGNLEYVNPKFTELTGYTSKEAIGKNLRIIKSGKQPDELYIELWETISSGKVWRGEFHDIKKNGELFWEAASVSPIFDNLGKITNYIKVAEDITERKQAEEELQKSETRQALVLRSLPMAFYIAQPFGDYGGTWVSEQIGKISGFTTEQFMNDIHLWASRLHPEDRDRVLNEFDKVLEKETIDIEYRWKAADGKYLWFLDSGVLIRDEKDRPIEIIGTWLDITKRKQSEEALRESEDKYRTIFESSPEAIILTDKKGNVLDINGRIEDWLGYKPRDISMKNFAVFSFMSNRSKALALKKISQRMRGEEIPPFELEFTDKNGEKRIGLTTASVIKDEKGEIIQNLVMISDITERKQAEEELRKERVSLARRVEERTADLSIANAELAKAAKMKDEFLASMSHELRTPLNAVLGLSEALQEEVYGEMNKKQHKSLRSIEESGWHLLSLINDILDIAKIEAGKVSLEINQVPIEVVCQASLRLVKQMALKKNLQLTSSIKTSLLTFGADERRLKQILVNLLSNAVKFTPEGGEVGIEVTEDADKEKINFTVWDTGIGIAKESMNKLFQSFVQIDSSLTREYSGTGLGLSLVKHLTELHGGCVTVESEPGEGSSFTITLPVETKTVVPAHKVEEGEDKPGKIETGKEQEVIVEKALILLAEDNEKNIEMLSDYLPAKGYNLVIARNGKEAVKVAKEQTPDLILMDIQMPGMDGLEATGIIRKNKDPKLAKVPVIALTALAMPGDKEECLAAGADDYIKKPVGLKYLVKKIEEILRT